MSKCTIFRWFFLFLILTVLQWNFANLGYGNDKEISSFYAYAGNFQRTCNIPAKQKFSEIVKERTKKLSIQVFEDYLPFGTEQWMIQNSESLFFHTDTSLYRISKESLEIEKQFRFSSENPNLQKKWYGSLTYIPNLQVLVGTYFQEDQWNLMILNPETLEAIQTVSGSSFCHYSYGMGVLEGNRKIIYLNYVMDHFCIQSLTLGNEPEILFSFSPFDQIMGASIQNNYLYVVSKSSSKKTVSYCLYCLSLSNGNVQWKFSLPEETQTDNWISYPICTPKKIILGHTQGESTTLYGLDVIKGTTTWKLTLPYPTKTGAMLKPIMSTDGDKLSVCVEAYYAWDSDAVSTILVISVDRGTILHENIFTQKIQSIIEIGDQCLITAKRARWIGLFDQITGHIQSIYQMKEGYLLTYWIVDENKIWNLTQNEKGEITIVKYQLS